MLGLRGALTQSKQKDEFASRKRELFTSKVKAVCFVKIPSDKAYVF